MTDHLTTLALLLALSMMPAVTANAPIHYVAPCDDSPQMRVARKVCK